MKNMFLAFLLLFASSLAFGDDITEWGEVVSVEDKSQGSDDPGRWTGRVTIRVGDVDTVYELGTGYCTRPYGSTAFFRNLLMTPYLRVRLRTVPDDNVPNFTCIVGAEVTNEKFLVP